MPPALSRESLETIPFSFASVSIGTPDDPLKPRLEALSKAGFSGIELGFPDLLSFAKDYHNRTIHDDDYDNLCVAGSEIYKLCHSLNLEIMMLQPFSNFEGWPKESSKRSEAFDRARGWIRIMEVLHTKILQVGSSDSEGIITSNDLLAEDLASLADILAAHEFSLAYENWCWSTHAPTWKSLWELVHKANRPNIGLCLDTFQTAGSEWADPTTESGLIEDHGSPEELEQAFQTSLTELSSSVPKDKIYLLQISDAYKPKSPIANQLDKDGLRPRGQWSHDFRPYPFNGGYLPVTDVAKAVLDTGARCWFSMEVFDGGPSGSSDRAKDFDAYASGAMQSMKKLIESCIA